MICILNWLSSAAIRSQLLMVMRNVQYRYTGAGATGKCRRARGLFKMVSLLISLQTFAARTIDALGFAGRVENRFACFTPEGEKKKNGRKNE